MRALSNFLKSKDIDTLNTLQRRQYRLIFIISYELIVLCSIIQCMYALSGVWFMVFLIGIAFLCSIINLSYLAYSKNTVFCGHAAVCITFISIIVANYVIGGLGTPYSIWFYLIPLLAVSMIGWRSLFIYSTFSLIMIIFFGTIHEHDTAHLTTTEAEVIEWANHIVAFFVIVTTLYSLMRETRVYEKILKDKNYLLQAEKDKFQHLSRYDPLTNLPNRQYFYQYLNEIIPTVGDNFYVTIFFMDLDNFKHINDAYGHDAGDHLLRLTAKRLRISFREEDFIARLGGDEFTAIVIHGKEDHIPEDIANRIVKEFSNPVDYEDHAYPSSISIGLATYPKDASTITNLINKADHAMYMDKKKRVSRSQS